jgi:hypothetical protein
LGFMETSLAAKLRIRDRPLDAEKNTFFS